MIALTTAIFGGIDDKKEVPEQTVQANQYFFNEVNSMVYDNNGGDNISDRIRALYFKTQGHKVVGKEEIIIWVDGKIQINSGDFIEQCVVALGDNDLAIMKHLYRKCVYEEVDHIEHCIRHGNDYLTTRYAHRPIRKQVESYRRRGYPENNGLNDCCIICRRNNSATNKLFDEWWDVCFQDFFDQVAIQFLAWKSKIRMNKCF